MVTAAAFAKIETVIALLSMIVAVVVSEVIGLDRSVCQDRLLFHQQSPVTVQEAQQVQPKLRG